MLEGLLMFFIQDALFLLGYLARGNAFPKPLSREEEAEMIERMQRGDRSAREKLIEHNLRLAAHIARKYTVPGYDGDAAQHLLRPMHRKRNPDVPAGEPEAEGGRFLAGAHRHGW